MLSKRALNLGRCVHIIFSAPSLHDNPGSAPAAQANQTRNGVSEYTLSESGPSESESNIMIQYELMTSISHTITRIGTISREKSAIIFDDTYRGKHVGRPCVSTFFFILEPRIRCQIDWQGRFSSELATMRADA